MVEIAVVIPCHNGSLFLPHAIASVLAQSREVTEIIVVDDASTDNSVAVAESFCAAGAPVRCIALERNEGPATARNIGVGAVKAPLVAFLDADDLWDASHCASVAPLLERYTAAVLAFSRARPLQDEEMAPPSDTCARGSIAQPRAMVEQLLYDSPVPQSGVIARRDMLLQAGGYTPGMRYSEDYDVWLRMAHLGPFVEAEAATCLRRSHAGQATKNVLKMYLGAWTARSSYAAFAACQPNGNSISAERYRSICLAAYERDLTWAW